MNHKLPAIGFIGIVVLLSFACTNEDNSANRLTMDAFATLPMQAVFEFTESDEVAFRFIRSIQIDSHGNVLVNDPSQPVVFMFDGQGNLIQCIGKQGRGPGEFQQIGSVLTTDDRLLVSDGRSLKIEIFEYLNSKYEYVRSVNVENPKLLGNLLGLTENGILAQNDIWFHNNPTETAISLLGHNGKVLQDTLFSVPVHEFVVDDSFVRGKIYGNSSKLAYDDSEGKVYLLWTESLNVDYFTLGGKKHHAFSYPLQPVAVTTAERDSALTRLEDHQRRVMRQQMPEVKPVAGDLVVDDHQRVWVELLSEELGHGWFAFSPDGDPLYHIKIPHPNAKLQDIQGNTILWNYTNELGAPTIVKSKFEPAEI